MPDLQIKKEFLKFNPSIPTEPQPISEPVKNTHDDELEGASHPSNKKQRGNKKQSRKQTNSSDEIRLCHRIESCTLGESCKFSHDVEAYFKVKGADLGPVCHNFETFGYCKYGLQCRFATQHLDENRNNIKDQEKFNANKESVSNCISKEVQKSVRSKTCEYPKTDAFYKEWEIQKKIEQEAEAIRAAEALIEKEARKLLLAQSAAASLDGESEMDSTIQSTTQSTESVIDITNAITETITIKDEATVSDMKCITETTESAQLPTGEESVESTAHTAKVEAQADYPFVVKQHIREKKLIDFRNKTYLAPLTTVGNLPFRRICKEFGVNITCGEMALSQNLLLGSQSEWALMKRHKSEDLFGVQLCGPSPYVMTKAAELVDRTCTVDFIDINCGCPIDMVFNSGAGSALLGRAPKMVEMLSGMSSVIDTTLTVKIRTGITDGKPIAHKLVKRFQDLNVGLITLHGRSRQQRYTKLADWEYIDTVSKESTQIPMFGTHTFRNCNDIQGNGDVMNYEDYYNHTENTSLAGVMIGRGALIKPWLFTEIKEKKVWDISSSERFDMLKRFGNYGLEQWGSDTMGINQTRRFMCEWLSFLCRYVPVGLLEVPRQNMNDRPAPFVGRDDLETLMGSPLSTDWVKLTEMVLGKSPADFSFVPKHKSNAYEVQG